MKRIILALSLIIAIIPVSYSLCSDFAWDGGDGTFGTPYGVSNCTQLQNIASDTDCLGHAFKLTQNIDCSASINWDNNRGFHPIGNHTWSGGKYGLGFNGTFDGQNFYISNMYIFRNTTSYIGLFGYVEKAGQIKNLGLVDVNITGWYYVGALVGDGYPNITNCYSTGIINYDDINGGDRMGGLVGMCRDNCYISNSYSSVDVNGLDYVGGLIGTLYSQYGSVRNSYAMGDVQGDDFVGGLMGWLGDTGNSSQVSMIYGSWANGTVSGTKYVGGLLGYTTYGIINSSYAHGNVLASTLDSRAGGLVGHCRGSIFSSYASGNVSGQRSVGGLVGSAYQFSDSSGYPVNIVKNSYARGDIDGTSEIGGLIGKNQVNINRCYSTGFVDASSTPSGGFVGESYMLTSGYPVPTITNSYWDKESSGDTTMCGIEVNGTGCNNAYGKTTTEMKQQSTFVNWNFTAMWIINTRNNGYPFLKMEIALPNYLGFSQEYGTTDFSLVEDITNVTNLTLATSQATIQFPANYSINAEGENYDSNVILGDCFVSVNSTELDYTFNATAHLTMNNSDGHCGDNRIYEALGTFAAADEIRNAGALCLDCAVLQRLNNHITKFKVLHFTGYAIGSNSELIAYDEHEGSTAPGNSNISFYANYTNRSDGQHIPSADCKVKFDSDPTQFSMTDNGNNYNYTKFFNSGFHTYNITCSKAGSGFNTLSALDNVTLSGNVPEFGSSSLILVLIGMALLMFVIRKR